MDHPVYHHNGFVATHALGHMKDMKYGYTLPVPMNQRPLLLIQEYLQYIQQIL